MKNLTPIHADHCAGDISLLEYKQFCHMVWSENHNFVIIDLASTPMNGKYCQNSNQVLFSYWYYTKLLSWKHTDQSSWKHLEISSLQQNYYRTKRCCMRKLQKSGMHNVIQTKWAVKASTAHI